MTAAINIIATTAGSQSDAGSPYQNLVLFLVMMIPLALIAIVIRNENRSGGHQRQVTHRRVTPRIWQKGIRQVRNYTGQIGGHNRPASNPGRDNISRPQPRQTGGHNRPASNPERDDIPLPKTW